MILAAALVAFAVSNLSMVGLLPFLRYIGALDTPNHRSSHAIVTPRGGGLALLLGLGCGLAVEVGIGDHSWTRWDAGLATIALGLGAVGFVDDVRGISALTRFGTQLASGVAMDLIVFQGSHQTMLALFGFGVVGVIWLAAYVNAFNFMDGINGISGFSAIVAGLWYAWVGNRYGDDLLADWGLLLTGAAIGFLLWNIPRAHVFLGDVGSYGLGAIIGFLAWWVAVRYKQPVTALAPLSIYLMDTASTLWRRYRAGASLLEAHREHVYQRLVALGVPHLTGTAIVLAFTTFVCAAVRWLPTFGAVLVSAAVLGAYVATPAVAVRLKGRPE